MIGVGSVVRFVCVNVGCKLKGVLLVVYIPGDVKLDGC